MKKTFATIIALCSIAAYSNAQGVFAIDSGANIGNGSGPTATTGGLVWLDPNGGSTADAILDTSTDINLTMIWGTSAGSVNQLMNLDPLNLNTPANSSWLASKPTGAGDMTSYADGAIFDPNGLSYVVPGQVAGNTIFVQLLAWTGNTTFPSGLTGETSAFPITLVANNNPNLPDIRAMPALVLSIPEPGTVTLALIGAMSFIAHRRDKSK